MITMAAGKFVYKQYVEYWKQTGQHLTKTPKELVEECELSMVDEWTHLGFVILTCLNDPKLIDSYNKGNQKVLDTLIGKTIRAANMTVEAEFIKELIPLAIQKWFK